jgi:hypothetical protein
MTWKIKNGITLSTKSVSDTTNNTNKYICLQAANISNKSFVFQRTIKGVYKYEGMCEGSL